MSKATATVDKKMLFPVSEKKAKGRQRIALKGRSDHRVSSDFFQNRESLYQLVDIVDYLFDGMIG